MDSLTQHHEQRHDDHDHQDQLVRQDWSGHVIGQIESVRGGPGLSLEASLGSIDQGQDGHHGKDDPVQDSKAHLC